MTRPDAHAPRFPARHDLYGGGLWIALSLPRPNRRARPRSRAARGAERSNGSRSKRSRAASFPTDHEPGAIEAGCVNFIDKALAHEDAQARPLYALGSRAPAVAQRRFARPFVKLTPAEQDELLALLEAGGAPGWPAGPVASAAFFATVRAHTIIGFLADPKYGGNRDFAGWKVVGYPGPRHHLGGYSPDQMLGRAKIKTVWGGEL